MSIDLTKYRPPRVDTSVMVNEAGAYNAEVKRYIAEQVKLNIAPLIKAMLKKAKAGDVFAFNALMDRSAGKPAQAIEHSGTDGQPIVFMPIELIQKHALEVVDGNNDVVVLDDGKK